MVRLEQLIGGDHCGRLNNAPIRDKLPQLVRLVPISSRRVLDGFWLNESVGAIVAIPCQQPVQDPAAFVLNQPSMKVWDWNHLFAKVDREGNQLDAPPDTVVVALNLR